MLLAGNPNRCQRPASRGKRNRCFPGATQQGRPILRVCAGQKVGANGSPPLLNNSRSVTMAAASNYAPHSARRRD